MPKRQFEDEKLCTNQFCGAEAARNSIIFLAVSQAAAASECTIFFLNFALLKQ
jgi:hypothetical protein